MLVLARKSKEIIRIGEHITVKVISIRNGQVKLGIEAPRELRVHRGNGVPGPTTPKDAVAGEGRPADGDVKPESAGK